MKLLGTIWNLILEGWRTVQGRVPVSWAVILFCLFSILSLSPETFAQTNCMPSPSGLVSWWPADGFALDVAGTNNGELQMGAGYVSGEVGLAFNLDGTNG